MNYDQRRGRISVSYVLTIGIALLVGVALTARQVSRASSKRVLVARVPIARGERIDSSKLGLATLAKNAIREGNVDDPNAVIGRLAQQPIAAGSTITPSDVAPANATAVWLSEASPAGRIVITLSVPGTLLPVQQLRMGDQLEVLAVSRNGESRVVGRDAYLIGSMNAKAETRPNGIGALVANATGRRAASGVRGLVLAVRPEDVAPIAQAEARGDRITFAVHGRAEIASGQLLDITPRAPRTSAPARKSEPVEVELIAGPQRGKVSIPR